jgi:hypothetical protein
MKFTSKKLIKENHTITRNMWGRMSDDEKIDALETAFNDPDEAMKYYDRKWEDLPSIATQNMYATEGKLTEDKKDIKEKITDFLTSEGVKFQVATGIGVIIAGLMRNPDLIDKLLSLIGLKEGSCGHSVDGNINPEDTSSNTPGGLKSMTADKRTQMVKNIMEKMKSNKS